MLMHTLSIITTLVTLYFFSRWAPAGEDQPFNERQKPITSLVVFLAGMGISLATSMFACLITIAILILGYLLFLIIGEIVREWKELN